MKGVKIMKIKIKSLSLVLALLMLLGVLAGCTAEIADNSKTEISETTATVEEKNLFDNFKEESIDADRILDYITELSSEKYAGRLPGTEGNILAANYLADFFKEIGLKSPEGIENFKQFYKQKVVLNNSAPILELVDKDGNVINSYKYINRFSPAIGGMNVIQGEVTAPVYHMESADEQYVGNENLKGKIIIMSEEVMSELNYRISKSGDMSGFNWMMDKSNGVKGVIGEQNLNDPNRMQKYFLVPNNPYSIGNSDETKGLIQMACNKGQFNEIKREAENGALVHMKVDYSVEEVEIPNIVGVIPGTDEKLKDEYIIISSHFDHVGDNKDGTYNPGALDNASGTAVMMEVARILQENKVKPKKAIVFISFNGEEEFCIGSKYYSENPIFPLEKTKVINMDMVGSKRYLLTYIMDHQLEKNKLKEDLGEYAKIIGLSSTLGTTPRSDHLYFNEKSVEAVTLISPDEKNGYHSPMDTVDKISKQGIKKVADLVLYYLDKDAY